MRAVGPSEAVDADGFVAWCRVVEPRLQLALMTAYGRERGREATAEALAWAWEHQERLAGLERPVAYLYRVGQTRTRVRRLRILYAIAPQDLSNARRCLWEGLVLPGLIRSGEKFRLVGCRRQGSRGRERRGLRP